MSELVMIALRTVITYVLIFIIMRLMGKREIGKLSLFDLVISIMIAEIAVIVIESPRKPLMVAFIPMGILMIIQIMISLLALKFRNLRSWFDGKPTILIAKGKLDRDAMRRQRYNLDDLLQQLRENRIASVGDVEFAILETSGKLSVIEKKPKQPSPVPAAGKPAERNAEADAPDTGRASGREQTGRSALASATNAARLQDGDQARNQLESALPSGYKFETLPIPLVMDGKVLNENLRKIEKTRFWLRKELQEHGVKDIKNVFLCTVDHKGELFVNLINSSGRT